MVLVDSNVLTDIFTEDRHWFEWSAAQIARCRQRGRLGVNPIIFAEVSPNFDSLEELEAALPEMDYQRLHLPYRAAFRASQAFLAYRQRGGTKARPLPDFYIGAHAEAEEMTLLTRDVDRYRTYFPKVKLITPESPENER